MSSHFLRELTERLERYRKNNWQDNWDFRRFGSLPARPAQVRVKKMIRGLMERAGMRSNRTLTALKAHEAELQWLYQNLQDDESRELLIDLMAYRILGHRKVKLPLNTPQYWKTLDLLDQKPNAGEFIELDFENWKLDLYDLADEGYPIELYARATGVYTQLLLQQYRCVAADHTIEVCAGDTVIDAGGCYGDTALYFAHKAGAEGRVCSFEFMPNNISVFERNLSLNPGLASMIDIVPNPVWSSSGKELFVDGVGPAARIAQTRKDARSVKVETLCIDDFAEREKLARVDFIKMDVEGAELEALKGAEATIRRDAPKLAVSVYHQLHDMWSIPQWIDSLEMGYRFYLRHFTIHAEETVLFAEAPR
jgi:FkbM family methyltransferase